MRTLVPDLIFIELDKHEFQNGVGDIPLDVLQLLQKNPMVKYFFNDSDLSSPLDFIPNKDCVKYELKTEYQCDVLRTLLCSDVSNKNTDKRYDVVIPYSSGSAETLSPRLKFGDKYEIEYVIQSLRKFCSWKNRIFLIGPATCPIESLKNDVFCICCDDPYTHIKDANIIHKIRTAIKSVDNLTDDFMFVSDDQIVTQDTKYSSFTPRVCRDYTNMLDDQFFKQYKDMDACSRKFGFSLQQTMQKFPNRPYMWEPHIWSPINKDKFEQMCTTYDYEHDTGIISQSLYYNFIKQPLVWKYDHVWLNSEKSVDKLLRRSHIPTNIGWVDCVYAYQKFRDFLDDLLFNER